MKIHWPIFVVLVLLAIAATGSLDSHAVGPLALQTGRFDMQVREDFFAGFSGNQAAFERAMSLCERTLQKDPNHPEAPRHLEWLPQKREFSYEKDKEFTGGFTRVFQVYGKFLQ